jgi:hypothetical protein
MGRGRRERGRSHKQRIIMVKGVRTCVRDKSWEAERGRGIVRLVRRWAEGRVEEKEEGRMGKKNEKDKTEREKARKWKSKTGDNNEKVVKVKKLKIVKRERKVRGERDKKDEMVETNWQKWNGAAYLPDVLPLALHLRHGLLQGKLLAGRGGDLLEPVPQSVHSSIYTSKLTRIPTGSYLY